MAEQRAHDPKAVGSNPTPATINEVAEQWMSEREVRDMRLTEAEADLVAQKLEERLVERFHMNLGRGVFALAWKAIVVFVIGVALYGSVKSGFNHFS